ncbi:MAG TPA: PQQ-binding-like beta-propeller repeat protein [Phycisphaerales bacterium]|nr:PQQ-binding-like beta-propeller repeat protein [Phycisphaerales bacterium]
MGKHTSKFRFVHVLGCLLATLVVRTLAAQQDNPVYVDDSPQARELFRQAQDQTRDNISQAVRLYQEILDQYPRKLIRSGPQDSPIFVSVRSQVVRELMRNPDLLNRYREVQTAAAAQMLEDGDLASVAIQRPLTEPGLIAMLSLAQREMEAAHFSSSIFWLKQTLDHPDLDDQRAASAWLMLGTCAHYLGDQAQFDAAMGALKNLGADHADFADSLEMLKIASHFPKTSAGISTFDSTRTSDLSHLVGQPIWTQPLEESLLNRRFDTSLESHVSDEVYRQHVAEADLNTMCPTVAGDTVYINEGHLVAAYNRITGQQLWTYDDLPKVAIISNDTEPVLDVNTVAVSGRSLVTLTGHALGTARTNSGTVICLDTQTGELRWALDRRRLMRGDDVGDMFPYGQPVIADDMVYITAREASRQQLTTEYILALDLNDGSLKWSQFVASSARLGLPPRSLTSLTVKDGAVYVASMIGAFARIDASTGLIDWLRTFEVPINAGTQDTGRMPWEIASPVLTTDALISVTPDQRRIVSLSKDTGEEMHSVSFNAEETWSPPRYLLADDQRLYLVGRGISAYHMPDLTGDIWRFPVRASDQPPSTDPQRGLHITGRVQLTSAAMIVPSSDGLIFLDPETGKETHEVALPTTGNPLAIDSQILIAGADRLESYMPMDLAQHLLRDRIAANPADPQPAMSLLQIARRAHDRTLFIEASDIAVSAIGRMDPADNSGSNILKARQSLLTLLVEADTPDFTNDQAFGEKLFSRMNAVAVEPAQRVEFMLRYGDWLSSRAVDRAVEQYQAILSDPVLGETWRELDGSLCAARIAATQRLSALLTTHGPTIYAAQADLAAHQLQALLADPAVEPSALDALADEYPLSGSAAEAVMHAAAMRVRNNQTLAALGAISHSSDVIDSGPRFASLLSTYVQINLDEHHLHDAASVLHSLVANSRLFALNTPNGPEDAERWLASIDPTAAVSRYPALGVKPLPLTMIPQRLLPQAIGINGFPAADRVFTEGEGSINCMDAKNLSQRWSVPIQSTSKAPDILSFDKQGTLFWCGTSTKGFATMVAENGSVAWTTAPASELLPASALTVRDRTQQLPDGRTFEPAKIFPLANTNHLVLLQASGAVTALSRTDGKTVAWSSPKLMDQVFLAIMNDSLLILAGRGLPPDADPQAADLEAQLMVIDAESGKIIGTRVPISESGIRWMTLDPLGRLVFATGDNIMSINAFTLERRWLNTQPAAIETRNVWALDNALVVEDRASGLRTLNWHTGALSGAFDGPTRGEWDPLDIDDVQGARGNIVARFGQRMVVFDVRGSIVGADVVNEDRHYNWLFPTSDHLIVVSAHAEPVTSDRPGGSRYQYTYRIFNFSDNGKLLDYPLELPFPLQQRVQNIAAIDGYLIFSTDTDIMALPLPVSETAATAPAQTAPGSPTSTTKP